jgi:hypothetical protein
MFSERGFPSKELEIPNVRIKEAVKRNLSPAIRWCQETSAPSARLPRDNFSFIFDVRQRQFASLRPAERTFINTQKTNQERTLYALPANLLRLDDNDYERASGASREDKIGGRINSGHAQEI